MAKKDDEFIFPDTDETEIVEKVEESKKREETTKKPSQESTNKSKAGKDKVLVLNRTNNNFYIEISPEKGYRVPAYGRILFDAEDVRHPALQQYLGELVIKQ